VHSFVMAVEGIACTWLVPDDHRYTIIVTTLDRCSTCHCSSSKHRYVRNVCQTTASSVAGLVIGVSEVPGSCIVVL
jgi:hypothetical protein